MKKLFIENNTTSSENKIKEVLEKIGSHDLKYRITKLAGIPHDILIVDTYSTRSVILINNGISLNPVAIRREEDLDLLPDASLELAYDMLKENFGNARLYYLEEEDIEDEGHRGLTSLINETILVDMVASTEPIPERIGNEAELSVKQIADNRVRFILTNYSKYNTINNIQSSVWMDIRLGHFIDDYEFVKNLTVVDTNARTPKEYFLLLSTISDMRWYEKGLLESIKPALDVILPEGATDREIRNALGSLEISLEFKRADLGRLFETVFDEEMVDRNTLSSFIKGAVNWEIGDVDIFTHNEVERLPYGTLNIGENQVNLEDITISEVLSSGVSEEAIFDFEEGDVIPYLRFVNDLASGTNSTAEVKGVLHRYYLSMDFIEELRAQEICKIRTNNISGDFRTRNGYHKRARKHRSQAGRKGGYYGNRR